MSFSSAESGIRTGRPFELYLWNCGGEFWGQTSGDKPRTHLSRVFDPAVLIRSEIDQNGEARSGAIEVTMTLDNPVAGLFLGRTPVAPVGLILFLGHEGESEVVVGFNGRVSAVVCSDTAKLTVVPKQDLLKQQIPGLTYQTQCPRRWGRGGCTVDRDAYRVDATLSSVAGVSVKSAAFAAKSDGWFRGGWIESPSGLGLVTAHTGDTLTLAAPIQGLAAGDVVRAYPSCQGTEADCSGRYGNLSEHLGFSRIPTRNPFGQGGL